jgi:protein-tyrosine phosphatase
MLVSDEEAQEKCGRPLRQEYQRRGLRLIHHPITDFGTPTGIEAFRQDVLAAADELRGGHSLLVHCAAGIGRTGLFVSCLVGLLRHLSAEQAIAFTRTTIRGAVETEEQHRFVREILASLDAATT